MRMTGPSDPNKNPFCLRQYFSIQAGPVQRGTGYVWFRFIFDGAGPRMDMQDQGIWMALSDCTQYGLRPEMLPYLTQQDVDDLAFLYKESIKKLDPYVQFIWSPL